MPHCIDRVCHTTAYSNAVVDHWIGKVLLFRALSRPVVTTCLAYSGHILSLDLHSLKKNTISHIITTQILYVVNNKPMVARNTYDNITFVPCSREC